MAIYKRGNTYRYEFIYAGQRIQESAKTGSKTVAREAEKNRRRELEEGFNDVGDRRKERIRTLSDLAADYLKEYRLKHRAVMFAEYAVNQVLRHLGTKMAIEISDRTAKAYQVARLEEQASPKSINEEVGFLLRIMGEQGDVLRSELRRQKILKLKVSEQPTGSSAANVHRSCSLQSSETSLRASSRSQGVAGKWLGREIPSPERATVSSTIRDLDNVWLPAGLNNVALSLPILFATGPCKQYLDPTCQVSLLSQGAVAIDSPTPVAFDPNMRRSSNEHSTVRLWAPVDGGVWAT